MSRPDCGRLIRVLSLVSYAVALHDIAWARRLARQSSIIIWVQA